MTKTIMNTRTLVTIALFSAITAVFSQIIIPLPFTPIPINLATLAVLLAAFLQKGYSGAISMIVYVLLGAFGLPVFSAFRGGIGMLMGPTGGYIFGYIAAALIVCLLKKEAEHILYNGVVMSLGIFACYAMGTAWFMLITEHTLLTALSLCVFPFLVGDALKIVAVTLLYKKMAKMTNLFL